MGRRWLLGWVILSAGMHLGALAEPVAAADATRVPSVGYVDPFGGWYLRSLFPLFRVAFDKARLAVGTVDVRAVESESGVWDLIRRFEVLILSDWDLADKHPRTFRRYLAAGGGVLMVTPYSGLRDRQDLMDPMPDTLRWLGIVPEARGVQDPKTAFGAYWWTRRISRHSVTDGVECLAFPKQGDYGRVATQRVELSRDWDVLVRAEKSARVFNVGFSHSSWFPAWEDSGEEAAEPPLFAVRKALNGRIALLPIDPGYIIWNVGNPAFPQVFMGLGDERENPSNGFRLIGNTLRWLAEPARSRGRLGGFVPDPDAVKPYRFPEKVAPVQPPPEVPAPAQFRGLIGARSDLSDGGASVAQYAAEARKLGLAFLFFAEPWESLSEGKLAQLRARCKEVSDESFRAIPGIQYGDTSGIRWVYLDPAFLPTADYLEPGTKLVKFDGRFAYNNWMKSGHLTRMPLGISRISSDPRSLWWYHFLPVWEWRKGALDSDNQKVFFQNIGNGLSYVPSFYADVSDLADLRSAAREGAMVVFGSTLGEAMGKIVSYAPWPLYEDNFSYVTQGPTIGQFVVAGWNGSGQHMVKTAGAQYFAVRVSVSSDAGLAEVALLSNDNQVHHRFLPQGAKRFSTGFVGVMDKQNSFVLRVRDTKGKLAYSTPHLAYTNTAGIYYCGDNLNTLQNANTSYYHPARQEFPGAPPNWPPYFYGWRGWDGLQNMVKQAYLQAPYVSVNASDGGELVPGDKYERPMELALASYFCNVFRTRSTRSVRYSFPENPNESATAVPVGETRFADQELFSIIPSCRAGLEYLWHRPVHADQSFENYRGSAALMEGRLHFKSDVQLAGAVQPIPVAAAGTWNTEIDQLTKYEPNSGLAVTQPIIWKADKLAPGGVLAAGPLLGAPFLANLGDAALQVEVSPQEGSGRLGGFSVGLAGPKQRVVAGTEMRFRVLSGFLEDGRAYGDAALDLAESLNLKGGTGGYPLTVRTGALVDARFMLTIEAEAHEAEWTAGPRRMVIDLPVRLCGVVDNGCLAFYERELNHFVFVPALEGDALFQVAIDEGVDVWCGNVFVSDRPELRLTLIGADEKQPRLEVHNPTDEPLKAKLVSPPHTPRFGGWSGEANVPAGGSVIVGLRPADGGARGKGARSEK
jgi:hypothetical protein